jgi:hypothetical protein
MPKSRTIQPRPNTKRGLLLLKVFIEHPILREKWEEEALSFHTAVSDYKILESMVKKFEEIQNSDKKYTPRKLPYTVVCHVKLKNILIHQRINY